MLSLLLSPEFHFTPVSWGFVIQNAPCIQLEITQTGLFCALKQPTDSRELCVSSNITKYRKVPGLWEIPSFLCRSSTLFLSFAFSSGFYSWSRTSPCLYLFDAKLCFILILEIILKIPLDERRGKACHLPIQQEIYEIFIGHSVFLKYTPFFHLLENLLLFQPSTLSCVTRFFWIFAAHSQLISKASISLDPPWSWSNLAVLLLQSFISSVFALLI